MKYSGFYHIGLIDRDFKLLYCDSPALFKRMLVSHVKLQNKALQAKPTETIYGTFTAEAVRYLVMLEQTLDGHFLVRIMPQIPDEVLDEKLLRDDIDQIHVGNFNIYTLFFMVLNFLDQCHYEQAREYVKYGLAHSSNLSVECMDLLNRFENDKNIFYVELRRKLIRTGDIINFAVADYQKRIYFTYDIAKPYVRVDYKQLEFAIYNLSKLAMALTFNGSESYFEISSVCDEFIDLFVKIPLQQNQLLMKFRNEIRAVKHVFKKLGGYFNFYEEEGYLCGSGYFNAAFSVDCYNVPRGMRLVVAKSIQEMLNRRSSNFWPVFNYDEKSDYLRAPTTRMVEELDSELRFARIFFEGIDLLMQD